jgi:inositol polyphosphate 5-phosphatase INPP5B/F
MLIIVLVRKELRAHISSISTTSAGVGFLNTLGNKGGVALRIQIRDTILCFVNSHLAAYDGMAEKRNLDYRELCRRLSFPLLAATPAEAANSPPDTAAIFDCECLFWMVWTSSHSLLYVSINGSLGRYVYGCITFLSLAPTQS